jgi:hypothetical protein
VRAVDNVAVDRVDMLVDGRPQTRITMSPNVTGRDREITDNLFFTGGYTLDTIGFTGGPHQIALRTFDTAGNRTDAEIEIKIEHPSVSMATPAAITARPGETVKLTYRWRGRALPERADVLTEIIDDAGRKAVARSFHKLPPRSDKEDDGDFAYSQDLDLPADIAPGVYKIAVRLFGTGGGISGAPVLIEGGRGVAKVGSGPNARNVIASLTVVSP